MSEELLTREARAGFAQDGGESGCGTHVVTIAGKIEAQNSWRYIVRTSGRLSYACSYHPTMMGLVAAK